MRVNQINDDVDMSIGLIRQQLQAYTECQLDFEEKTRLQTSTKEPKMSCEDVISLLERDQIFLNSLEEQIMQLQNLIDCLTEQLKAFKVPHRRLAYVFKDRVQTSAGAIIQLTGRLSAANAKTRALLNLIKTRLAGTSCCCCVHKET
ncbi:uncharacterized protein LOC132192481 [Neocloeon triangulifer]|uniref:uncharacterized protein LOC132192481 n=1 Tax=Neocloeon triangulifer TaxID=2078957 RepID=UPI00286F22A8|nr:uncharacterized protein LOC132192481 [Neocloeon triangulifer]